MRKWMKYLLCLTICLLLMPVISGAEAALADGLEVHFMDIGRCDGILIRCGGEAAFIDSGGYGEGEKATAYMQSVGVTKLKYYIGTHGHYDHVGGAPVIIEAFSPEAVLQPHKRVGTAIINNSRTAEEKKATKAAEYVTMTVGQQVQVGGATLTCLGPVKVVNVSMGATEENANSLVLMLTYGETDILLTGDATSNSMLAIEKAYPGALKADVYKNAHHRGAARENVIAAIDPEWTIFSTSAKSTPASTYVTLLSNYGSRMLMTSSNHSGNIVLHTDGKQVSYETQYAAESLTLNKTEIQVYEGKKDSIKATLKPSGRFKMLTYSSDDPSIATVTGDGRIVGVSAGQTIIRVSDGVGIEAECRVTVLPATIKLRKTSLSVNQHSKVSASWTVTPSGCKPSITWASKDPSIASVDEKGRITGVYPGETTITATTSGGQVSELAITVKPIKVYSVSIKLPATRMTIGSSMSAKATVSPKNATWPEVTWSSEDESIVTVSQDGVIQAVGVGRTKITAETIEGKKRTATITVQPKYIKRIYLTADVTKGLIGGVTGRNQVNVSHVIEPADATIQQVLWSTSNKKIATVDENGVVTGHAAGTVYITCKATDGSGKYTRVKLTFGKNELNRKVVGVNGELVAQAQRIRYYSTDRLEIQLMYINRTGTVQPVPERGILTLIAPDGTEIPLMQITTRQVQLKNRYSRLFTYKVPLSVDPRLKGLDLSRCEAVIIDPAQR